MEIYNRKKKTTLMGCKRKTLRWNVTQFDKVSVVHLRLWNFTEFGMKISDAHAGRGGRPR